MNIDHMNMIMIILIFHNERVAPKSTFRSRLGFRACIQFKNSRESIRETGNSYYRVASCSSARSFSLTVPSFLSIFVHISGLIDPTILIWVSMERYFPPAELKNFTAPFNNMRTLTFKAQPTNAFFATVNQVFGDSS